MKKIISLFLIALTMFSLVGCKKEKEEIDYSEDISLDYNLEEKIDEEIKIKSYQGYYNTITRMINFQETVCDYPEFKEEKYFKYSENEFFIIKDSIYYNVFIRDPETGKISRIEYTRGSTTSSIQFLTLYIYNQANKLEEVIETIEEDIRENADFIESRIIYTYDEKNRLDTATRYTTRIIDTDTQTSYYYCGDKLTESKMYVQSDNKANIYNLNYYDLDKDGNIYCKRSMIVDNKYIIEEFEDKTIDYCLEVTLDNNLETKYLEIIEYFTKK